MEALTSSNPRFKIIWTRRDPPILAEIIPVEDGLSRDPLYPFFLSGHFPHPHKENTWMIYER